MELTSHLSLIETFMQNAAAKYRAAQLAEANEHIREQEKERKERRHRDDMEREHWEELLATAEQTEAFRNQLSAYDTATVSALIDNGRALDDVRLKREQMETSAFRLQDGRLVFKSEDGARVFSKDGTELSRDTILPTAIPDSGPRWEAFKGVTDHEHTLLRERDALHAYQQRLDEARETVDKGNVTADALAKMDADLKRDMPMGVKERLPGALTSPDAPDADRVAAPRFAMAAVQRSPGLAGP